MYSWHDQRSRVGVICEYNWHLNYTVLFIPADISILGPACAGGGILLLVAISFSVLWYKKNKDKTIESTGIGQQEHAGSMEHKKSAGMYSDLELATKPAKKEAQR